MENISFDRLNVMDGIKNYTNGNNKIVRFALNDEGDNAFVLLDLINKKVVSYSITGTTQFNDFKRKYLIGLSKTDNFCCPTILVSGKDVNDAISLVYHIKGKNVTIGKIKEVTY